MPGDSDSTSADEYNTPAVAHASEKSPELTIEALANRVHVPVRTVRYYITERLLSGPRSRGKAASYTIDHLLRLRLIRRLVEQRVPLAEVRERLAGLSTADVMVLLEQAEKQAGEIQRASESAPAREYVSALLARSLARQRGLASDTPAEEGHPDASTAPALPRPQITQTWRRIELAPGIELHIRSDTGARHKDLIQRLLRAATGTRRSSE